MQYKILLVGDAGVGKTTFLQKYFSNNMELRYLPTLGCEVTSINYNDNIQLSVWDCAGQEKNSGLKDGYFTNAHAAIVFYDTTSNLSKNNVQSWINSIKNIRPNIPIILCGTKTDIGVKAQFPTNNKSCIISTKLGYNLDQPFKLVIDALND